MESTTSKAEKQESKIITISEAAKHCTNKDCYLIIDNKVYDVTKFLEEVLFWAHLFLFLSLNLKIVVYLYVYYLLSTQAVKKS